MIQNARRSAAALALLLLATTATAGSAPTSVTNATAMWAVTSAGQKALGVAAVDMVTGLTKIAQGALGLTYQLDATPAAGVVASSTRVVTYTITGGT